MAILELDKIVIKKARRGIFCLRCGGDLKERAIVNVSGKIIGWILSRGNRSRYYECANCKKKYTII